MAGEIHNESFFSLPKNKEPKQLNMRMKYSYKVITVAPAGLRVSGDDKTSVLSELLQKESNALGAEGWEMVSVLPTLSSGGSVSKIMVVYKRPHGDVNQ